MRRGFIFLAGILLVGLMEVSGLAQDKLQGRWEGKAQTPQGEMPAAVTFKKEGDVYSGTITSMRGVLPLKEIKIAGDNITAQSQLDAGGAVIVISYKFTVQGEKLAGKGELDFGGQTMSFDFDLKKVSDNPAAAGSGATGPAQQGGGGQQGGGQQRAQVPQPQQKPSLNYFAGQWSFKWVGRESPLGPGGPREGTVTFKADAAGKTLEGRMDAKTEEGPLTNTMIVGWDESTKTLTFSERMSNGIQIMSKGDWSSPISIRCTVEPIKVKGHTLQLKRTIAVIAAHSFSITEELSEDGGPFIRLGNALFTRVSTVQ
jgi:hypothetical protein